MLGALMGASGCANHRPAAVLIKPGQPAVNATKSKDGFDLRLVTYNIWGLPSWVTGAPRGRYPRICSELERLDPDIILLQEAWTAKARQAAPANGRWSIARASGQHTLFQQNGLVTLSKMPIVDGAFYPYSKEAFPDRLVNKGVLKITVQLQDGQLLNVWNTHLQKSGAPKVQRAQIRELVQHVKAAEDGQIADLVGGDFNCTPGSDLYQELETSLGPSLHQLQGLKPMVTWTSPPGKPGSAKTLDYVFVRPRRPVQEIQAVQRVVFESASVEQRLSDHLGLEAEVRLQPATSLARALGAARPSRAPSTSASSRRNSAGGE